MYLKKIKNESDLLTFSLHHEAFFHSDSEIIFLSWISESLIYMIDSRKISFVIHSAYIDENISKKGSKDKTNKLRVCQINLSFELCFQTAMSGVNKSIRPFYQNCIVSHKKSDTVYILGNKNFYKAKIFSWQTFFK